MKFPKMKVRPFSLEQINVFGGLDHHQKHRLGNWFLEKNLSSDAYPNFSVRKAHKAVTALDGNEINNPIIAMCGGDHIVLLDSMGFLHCNGNKINLGSIAGIIYAPSYTWTVSYEDFPDLGGVTPASGDSSYGYTALPFMSADEAGPRTVRLMYDAEFDVWATDLSGNWRNITPTETVDQDVHYTFSELGVEVVLRNDTLHTQWPDDQWVITITASAESAFSYGDVRLVRMGANVVVYPARAWVNAEVLASGVPLTPGTDYGMTDALLYSNADNNFTLTMCDIDGNPYSGIVASATEPDHISYHYWVDTSGETAQLREWSVSSSGWVAITSTYVKISTMDLETVLSTEYGSVKQGDTVQMFDTLPGGTDQAYIDLLNGAHYLYHVDGPDEHGYGSIVISGVIPEATKTFSSGGCYMTREMPIMDFMVECGNRLWGCRYGLDIQTGETINEIYCSKLGDVTNWESYQGLSTDSWRASRGIAAPFTGAAVLDGHPLFFREESLEKVYPSASGAHQIQTFDIEGVEQGAADSLVVIDDRLYYKARNSVMCYTGTRPARISEALGDVKYNGGVAARHGKKYVLKTYDNEQESYVVLVYDTKNGIWHDEDEEGWDGQAVTWKDEVYYVRSDEYNVKQLMQREGGTGSAQWSAETAPIEIQYSTSRGSGVITEHKFISYIRSRYRKASGCTFNVFLQYDSSGTWENVLTRGPGHDNALGTQEINIFPRRCDHLQLKFSGTGYCEIFSITFRVERSEGGH